mmetsp:Transcript_19530/g.31312  ORF Transcript_19530/g.31312 Transcript_19530/m.31312 type:complete len:491 (+) Transcript_19530:68-1540(+)
MLRLRLLACLCQITLGAHLKFWPGSADALLQQNMTVASFWKPMAISPDLHLSWTVLGEMQPRTKISILFLTLSMVVSLAVFSWHQAKPFAFTPFEPIGSASAGSNYTRLAHLDNAKFILVTCVIVDHMSRSAYWPRRFDGDHSGMSYLDSGIREFLLFHTRTLCFISGLVGRSPPDTRMFRKVLFRLVLPLIFFVGLFRMGELILNYTMRSGSFMPPGEFAYNLKQCLGGLNIVKGWYLQALILWRIWGCILMILSPSARIVVSLVMAIVGGYTDWNQFCVARAMTLMPLYVAGQLFPWEAVTQRWQWTLNKAILGASLLLLIFVGECTIAAPLMADMPDMTWEINESLVPGGISEASFLWARGLARNVFEISKGMIFLLMICPRGDCFISAAGRFSLYSYLLHGPATLLLPWLLSRWLPGLVFGTLPIQIGVWLGVFAASTFVAWILASRPVRYVAGVFLEPVWAEKCFAATEDNDCESLPHRAVKIRT